MRDATHTIHNLEAGIRCFNVESSSELARLNQVAATHGVRAPVSLRVNPDVDAHTHPYISTGLKENKFGISVDAALDVYRQAAESSNLQVEGIDCHIGSQLVEITPFVDALDRVLDLVNRLESAGISLRHIDLGGGLGVPYHDEHPPSPQEYVRPLLARLASSGKEILPEIKQMLDYVNRVGISIVHNGSPQTKKSAMESYLTDSGLLTSHRRLIRMDVMGSQAAESRLIEGIKTLISE